MITVRGPKKAGMVEVATFRQDAAYSDGRHPDHVTFSSAGKTRSAAISPSTACSTIRWRAG